MIVLDTSALLAILLGEASKAQLIELTKGQSLIAPQSLHWEVANAFSAKFKRNPPLLSLVEAQAALEIYKHIPLRFVEIDFARAVEIAFDLNIYAYDAYLIACAQKKKCALLSLDRGLKHAAKRVGITVLEVKP